MGDFGATSGFQLRQERTVSSMRRFHTGDLEVERSTWRRHVEALLVVAEARGQAT